MAYPETLPPSNRTVGSADPPGDHNTLTIAVGNIDSRLNAVEAPSVVAKTSSFSFSTNELNKIVTVSNAAAQNATMPSITASTGQTITVINIGAGTWTFVPTSGNVKSYGSVFGLPAGATATLVNYGSNLWNLAGQLS